MGSIAERTDRQRQRHSGTCFQIKALDKELKSFMKKMKTERTINLKPEDLKAPEDKKDEKKSEDNKTGEEPEKKTEL